MRIHDVSAAFVFLFLSFLISGCKFPQKTSRESSSVCGIENGTEYCLTVFEPHTEEKFPLLVGLHGHGGNGRDYLNLWKREADRRGVMLLAPTRKAKPGERIEPERIDTMTQTLIKRYPVDRTRLYLAGISSGARFAGKLLLLNPARWQAAILIASPPFDKNFDLTQRHNLPPLLFVHGMKDNQFPFKGVEQGIEKLRQNGTRADLLSFKDAGHEQRPEWSKEIFDWIEKNSGGHS